MAANNHGQHPKVWSLSLLDEMDAVEVKLHHALLSVSPDMWRDMHHATLNTPDIGNDSLAIREFSPGIFLVIFNSLCAVDCPFAVHPSASG